MKEILISDCYQSNVFQFANTLFAIENLHVNAWASGPIESFSTKKNYSIHNINKNSSLASFGAYYNENLSKYSLDVAVLVFSPSEQGIDYSKFSNFSKMIDQQIKQRLLQIRQLDSIFNRKEGGLLIPILCDLKKGSSMLDKIAHNTLSNYIDELIADKNTKYTINAFDLEEKSLSELTPLIHETLLSSDKKNCWIRGGKEKSRFSLFK